jgi:hypothetical protein
MVKRRAAVPDTVMHLDDGVAGEALLGVLARVKAGDFSARMPLGWTALRHRGGGRRRTALAQLQGER